MQHDPSTGSSSHTGSTSASGGGGGGGGEVQWEVVVNQVAVAGPSRPQADPLPSKRGEIGYREPEQPPEASNAHVESQVALPARHPADRAPTPTPNVEVQPNDTSTTASNGDAASMRTNHSVSKSILAKLKPRKGSTVRGILLSSVLIFVGQIFVFIATIAGWALLTNHISRTDSGSSTTQIFLHVAFAIASLAQLVFVERSIYHMRAQRWAHVHGPGLPMHNSNGERRNSTVGIGFAPWNRPPLPTYAAALAQSGVGTGDVEDNVIAVPPPPEYGNTRGSTLLLSGMLTDTMRDQRAQARAQAIARANASETGSVRGSWMSERPISYASRDEEWEERRDASRAAVLEETLARLDSSRPIA
ncbi:hypothetical protein BDY19DRAFT_986325 [Irpex rosettiformis]|uniref:Uncharacterized protein n=1 Tax=Irpex rosettiformis TaxID=378272 RepID=A0ACB8TYD3_9APHY|nr:hypothetical protein BDY19DRAFT_986325 [Irpex rosettiformis]